MSESKLATTEAFRDIMAIMKELEASFLEGDRAPMTWELHIPHPPPWRKTFETDARIAAVEKQFAEVYPDARIIHTHRDPAQVMPSLASLRASPARAWLRRRLRRSSSGTVAPRRSIRPAQRTWSPELCRFPSPPLPRLSDCLWLVHSAIARKPTRCGRISVS